MRRGRTGKISASPGGTETIAWNRCLSQVSDMVGTNASTNKRHKVYNLTVQAISRGGGYCTTTVGALCGSFVDIGSPVKAQVENGLTKLFDFQDQTIDVSDQAIFILNYLGLRDEEVKKTDISDLLTAAQKRSGHFLSFMVTVYPDQDDPKFNYICMTFRACIKIPFNVYGIYASIYTQMMKKPHVILVHLVDLYYGRNTDIGTLKKDRGDIFSERCTESFKIKFLRYFNEVLFKMVKTYLKDTYLGGTTHTSLQTEVYAC